VGFEKFTADSYEEKKRERQRFNTETGAQRTRRNEKRRPFEAQGKLEALRATGRTLRTSGQAGATTLKKSTD